jgi:hypothetical protein
MLSRQIDNDGGRGAVGYKDGAEQLERKKSQSNNQAPELKIADLQELDALVRDPSKAMQKLTLDTGNRQTSSGEVPANEDMPILPQAPGIGLRRSTRTTYRRGSLRKGERVPFSKRAGSIRGETDGEESPISSPVDGRSGFGHPLTKVQSEPTTAENFSRPNRGARRLQNVQQMNPLTSASDSISNNVLGRTDANLSNPPTEELPQLPKPGPLPRSNSFPRNDTPVPRIVETPPPPEEEPEPQPPRQTHQFPERSSSQTPPPPLQQKQVVPEPPARSSKRPGLNRETSSSTQSIPRVSTPTQTLDQMAQHPSPLPGNSARTDSLSFIPTLEEKKSDKKSKRDKDDESSGSRKPSWGWFKGSDEKDKKDKKKDDDHKESKRNKAKAAIDKAHDSARLDVLQSTMDTAVARGRESLLLDRDSIENKLQDERKKESSRKSGGEGKKEKDGLFSSFFGGSKKKNDRDSGGKKGSSLRTLSPDPPHRDLKPDIDYNWTRFSILEERAIYRMAHIKLANPRRALYSQVLLSNFMYSYLAKVQQMHPQMQIPQSALQKKQDAERQQKEQEQRHKEEQQQRQESGGEQYRYDYHQVNHYHRLSWTELTCTRESPNMLSLKIRNLRASTMWMTRKFMITTTRTKNHLMGRIPIDHSRGLLNTIRRMVMVIKISSMDAMGMNITLTAILKVTTTALKTMMKICGDCSVDDIAADLSCSYAYTMESSALFILRTDGMVGLSVFGKVIVGSIASGGLELFIGKPRDKVLSCHLRLQRQCTCLYVPIP